MIIKKPAKKFKPTKVEINGQKDQQFVICIKPPLITIKPGFNDILIKDWHFLTVGKKNFKKLLKMAEEMNDKWVKKTLTMSCQ